MTAVRFDLKAPMARNLSWVGASLESLEAEMGPFVKTIMEVLCSEKQSLESAQCL